MSESRAKTLGALAARVELLEREQATAREERRQDFGKVFQKLDDLNEAVGGLKPSAEELGLPERIRNLETWRNIIVGGAAVTWLMITVACYVTYDWVREHISTIIEIKPK